MKITPALERFIDKQILTPFSKSLVTITVQILGNWQYAIAAFSALIAIAYISTIIFVTHHFFWDFRLYVADIKSMTKGISPYDLATISSIYGKELSPFPVRLPTASR